MKAKLLATLLLAGSSMFAGPRVVVGFGYGVPAPVYAPPAVPVGAYYAPAVRPGYAWVGGYYYPNAGRWAWRPGYYARRPYAHAYWVAPRWHGGRWYRGYWR